MAKKRLSDLLREEVNKSADGGESAAPSAESASTEASAQPDPTPAEANATDPTPTQAPQGEPLRLGLHPSQQGKAEAPAPEPIAEPIAELTPTNGTGRRHSPTKADLEATIAELKTQLAAAQQQSQQQVQQQSQQQETQLNQQLDRLQTEVKRQQATIEQLQGEIQHAKSLRAELEEARQVILKLSEINAKPVDAKYNSGKYADKDADKYASDKPASDKKISTARQDGKQAGSQAVNPAINGASGRNSGATPAAPLHYVKAGESKEIVPQLAAKSASPEAATSKSGAPLVPAPSNAAEPELESKPVQLTMPKSGNNTGEDAGKLAPSARHQQELRRILDHPIRPGALPPMPTPSTENKKLSETDMGWVD
jgi:hypothetical protein